MSEERSIVGKPTIMARMAKGGFMHEHEIHIDGKATGIIMSATRKTRDHEIARTTFFDGKEYATPKDAIAAYDQKQQGAS